MNLETLNAAVEIKNNIDILEKDIVDLRRDGRDLSQRTLRVYRDDLLKLLDDLLLNAKSELDKL